MSRRRKKPPQKGAATSSQTGTIAKLKALSRWRKVLILLLLLASLALIVAALVLTVGRLDDEVADGTSATDADAATEAVTDQGVTAAAPDAGPTDAEVRAAAQAEALARPAIASVIHGSTEGQFDGTQFLATFDGEPSEPLQFNPFDWDITVHSRDPATWESLDLVNADHDATCSPPPDTHPVTAYEDTVYLCRNHMMTSIRGDSYGAIYLTPPYQVDFSQGTAVISVDLSTLRSSARDWWDIWISPYDDSLQLPLAPDAAADLTGPPANAVRIGLREENQVVAEIYEDFENLQFPEWPEQYVSGDYFTGYEQFLDPDVKRRDTFEIRISSTHLQVGMPQYDFWWIDTDIPELDWSTGVVQFGHHSYNPTKGCNEANNPIPPVDECLPTTWHWDNVVISPAVPFTIVRAEQRTAHFDEPTMTFVAPAPEGAHLRFAGIGTNIMVRFDDGEWQPAIVQQTFEATKEEHFSSYWLEVPAGTTQVQFQAQDWFGGGWHVRDASFWSPTS